MVWRARLREAFEEVGEIDSASRGPTCGHVRATPGRCNNFWPWREPPVLYARQPPLRLAAAAGGSQLSRLHTELEPILNKASTTAHDGSFSDICSGEDSTPCVHRCRFGDLQTKPDGCDDVARRPASAQNESWGPQIAPVASPNRHSCPAPRIGSGNLIS
jgi:hypothetical protein